jgi:hypothetical protein
MSPSRSPNDPVFYLNLWKVDRIWERWMNGKGRNYLPPAPTPASLLGHRLDDQIVVSHLGANEAGGRPPTWLASTATIRSRSDPGSSWRYG